jgi:hypothetical protein
MAGPIKKGSQSGQQRVFVLVDKGIAQGVFPSWDAAEAFADEHRLSLDKLMEYVTRSDHPDHLHLLTAQWEGNWEFQGEWTNEAPDWPKPPRQVRLDHYHAKGNKFHLLRRKEFTWEAGLLQKVNPMAPDEAIKSEIPTKAPAKSPQWKPKLSPLKPLHQGPSSSEGPSTDRDQQDKQGKPPLPKEEKPEISPLPKSDGGIPTPAKSLVSEPEPPIEDSEKGKSSSKGATKPPATKVAKRLSSKAQPGMPPVGLQPGNKKQKKAKKESSQPAKSKISFQKKPALKLKPKEMPEPIPSFKATASPTDHMGNAPSSVELAQAQHEARVKAEEEKRKADIKVKRVWSIRLILTVVLVVACWAGGIIWALKPEPTAANIVTTVTSLTSARKIVMEPDMIFFQLPVDPAHQERWIQSLGLLALDPEEELPIPLFHSLDTWEKSRGYIRPPYSETEVNEWWDLRLRKIRYGYVHEWEDGTILILDLESDTLIGWAYAKRLPDLLN